jgi:hypothetical protein
VLVLAVIATALGLSGNARSGKTTDGLVGEPMVSPEYPVSDPAQVAQTAPSIAFDGTNYLAAWGEGSSLLGARIGQDGGHLDGLGFGIQTGGSPSVAFGGTNYLVAWNTVGGPPQIKAARVAPTGQVLDPGGITITAYGMYDWNADASVAFNGANYLVVWRYQTDIIGYERVRAGRVMPDGTVWGVTNVTNASSWNPTVAAGNTNSLAAWEDRRSWPPSIYAARVTDGGILDTNGILIEGGQNLASPGVGFDGTNYLVVWSNGDIYGKRVSPQGVVLDANPIPISTASANQAAPKVAFDGTNYVVAWQDNRSGASYDVYAARVAPDGTVLDPAGLPIATSPTSESDPAATAGSTGRVAISYVRVADESPYYGVNRVFFRIVDDGTPPPPPPPPPPPQPPPPPPPPPPQPPPPPPPPTRCRVPRVIGLALGRARARIRRANCRVGRVIRRRSPGRVGRVLSQSPRPGTNKRRGFPVGLVVGRR